MILKMSKYLNFELETGILSAASICTSEGSRCNLRIAWTLFSVTLF